MRRDKRGKNGSTTISHLHSRGRTSIRGNLKGHTPALIALAGERLDGRARGLSFCARRNSIEGRPFESAHADISFIKEKHRIWKDIHARNL